MKRTQLTALTLSLLVAAGLPASWANTKNSHSHEQAKEIDHKHSETEEHHDEDDDHDHDKKGHDHAGSGEAKHEEGSDNVGPEKGIVQASEEFGIKLSKEATANFDLKTQKLIGQGPWTIPASARLQSGEEINIYRVRNEFYKRIDFITVSKSNSNLIIRSPDLKDGDLVVIQGIGFLRIAELVAFGGAPEGHSH